MIVLILHGIEGHAGIHWQRWLHDELAKAGHDVLMPDLPETMHPNRRLWLKTALDAVKDKNSDSLVIVGHSLGVVTALDFIEKTPVKALISVAGFSSDYGRELTGYFLKEKDIDFKKIKKNLGQAFVFYAENDPYVPQIALRDLADCLKVAAEIIPNGGHFNTEAGYTTFPRLLEVIKGI